MRSKDLATSVSPGTVPIRVIVRDMTPDQDTGRDPRAGMDSDAASATNRRQSTDPHPCHGRVQQPGRRGERHRSSMRMGPMSGHGQRQMQRHANKQARFQALDTDRNGEVSQVEFMEGGRQRFARSDLDKDGNVTPWEFRSNCRSWQ